ncbi:MAG: hypothetical protein ACRCY9_00650 [Phycicoccus sp.]
MAANGTPPGVEVTMEVLSVRRVTDGTVVALRLSAARDGLDVGPSTFAMTRVGAQSFIRDVLLTDEKASVRYRPLQFDDGRAACVCPYVPLALGRVPQVVHAVLPALPSGTTTVRVRLGDTRLDVGEVPVTG